MATDLFAGNWYRIWTVNEVYGKDGGVFYPAMVVVASEDKNCGYKIEARSNDDAEQIANDIASALREHPERPLWRVLDLDTPDVLNEDIRSYDALRMQNLWKATDLR